MAGLLFPRKAESSRKKDKKRSLYFASCELNFVIYIAAMLHLLCDVAWFIGLAGVLFLVAKALLEIWKRTLRAPADLRRFGAKAGGWAIVTGASDGIGKEYALQLAAKGLNIFLVSRTESKLQSVAEEIESKYPQVKTEILAIDFAKEKDGHLVTEMARIIETKCNPVGILVNNAAMNYESPVYFCEADKEMGDAIIKVNIQTLTDLTHLVLPKMVARGVGAVLNISSGGGCYPVPFLAVYSASKAYVRFFSRCLATEYRKQGIVVQNVTPGLTESKMAASWKNAGMTVAPPSAIAKGSIATIGLEDHWSPYYGHAIQECLLTHLHQGLLRWMMTQSQLRVRKVASHAKEN